MPLLLIVAPFQKRIALLLFAVLPLHVVVLSRFSVRPPTSTLRFGPVIATSLLKVVLAAPDIVPPVQLTGPWNVVSVPVMVLPLSRNAEVCVPPFTVTVAPRLHSRC